MCRRCEWLGAPVPTLGANGIAVAQQSVTDSPAGAGAGAGAGEPTAGTRQSISHPLPPQKFWPKGRDCRTRPLAPRRTPVPSPAEGWNSRPGGTCTLLPRNSQRDEGFWSRWRKRRSGQAYRDANSSIFLTNNYLYNFGGLGASGREIEGDSLLRVTYFLWTWPKRLSWGKLEYNSELVTERSPRQIKVRWALGEWGLAVSIQNLGQNFWDKFFERRFL